MANLGNDPRRQARLRLSGRLSPAWEVDIGWRHVGELSGPRIPASNVMDLRLGWRPLPGLALSLGARNAADSRSVAFEDASAFGRHWVLRAVWGLP